MWLLGGRLKIIDRFTCEFDYVLNDGSNPWCLLLIYDSEEFNLSIFEMHLTNWLRQKTLHTWLNRLLHLKCQVPQLGSQDNNLGKKKKMSWRSDYRALKMKDRYFGEKHCPQLRQYGITALDYGLSGYTNFVLVVQNLPFLLFGVKHNSIQLIMPGCFTGRRTFLSWHKASTLLLRKSRMFMQSASLSLNASCMVSHHLTPHLLSQVATQQDALVGFLQGVDKILFS